MALAFAPAFVAAIATAFATSWWLTGNAARLGLVDVPNKRSAHRNSMPRAGGIGIAVGVLAGFFVLAAMRMAFAQPLLVVLAGSAVIAILGLLDDIRSIPAPYRLAVQALVAVAVVFEVGGVARLPLPPPLDLPLGWLGAPLAVLWLVTLTNFFNFMDGLDGIAGGQAVATCAAVLLAGWAFGATQFAIVLAGATSGFLILNLPPARIFLGDGGSTALGFSLAVLPLLAPTSERHRAILVVAIALALFLLDPLVTILRRVRGGHRLHVAHRSHSYQQIARAVGGHWSVTASLLLGGLLLAVGGGLSYRFRGPTWPLLGLAAIAFSAELMMAARLEHVREDD